MDLIISLIGGGLIGFFISRYFSNETRKQLEDTVEVLQEQLRELTIQLSAAQKLLMHQISSIKDTNPQGASELESKIESIRKESLEVVEALPEKVTQDVDLSPFRNTHACPTCGKESKMSGWGRDPAGINTWWYSCPEHGRFPSMYIEDWFDE
jgi:uncharacterized protein YneF (UPF0154 family)